MTELNVPDDTDIQAEKLRYALTQNKELKMQHVTISKPLLAKARAVVKKQTQVDVPITNQTLVKYALLKLFEPTLQTKVCHRLADYHSNSSLQKLLAVKQSPKQAQLNQIDNALQEQHLATEQTDVLLMAIINALGWLIYDRNGLDHLKLAQNSDELLSKLRQDDLKPYLDRILDAGLDEAERQRHYQRI